MRRSLLGLVVVLVLLALFDVFGQSPSTTSAAAAAATLHVDSPGAVRGGLLYQARFTIEAHEDLKNATLVLDPGWLEGMTVNTIEPSPVGEASRDGKLALELGHVPAGEKYVLFLAAPGQPDQRRHPHADGRARRRRQLASSPSTTT